VDAGVRFQASILGHVLLQLGAARHVLHVLRKCDHHSGEAVSVAEQDHGTGAERH